MIKQKTFADDDDLLLCEEVDSETLEVSAGKTVKKRENEMILKKERLKKNYIMSVQTDSSLTHA